MNFLATLLHTILSCLQAGIAPRATQRRPRTEVLVWSQIDLLAAQFEQLYAQWRAGTLPDCRRTSHPGPSRPGPSPRPTLRRPHPAHPAPSPTATRDAPAHPQPRPDLTEPPQPAAPLPEIFSAA